MGKRNTDRYTLLNQFRDDCRNKYNKHLKIKCAQVYITDLYGATDSFDEARFVVERLELFYGYSPSEFNLFELTLDKYPAAYPALHPKFMADDYLYYDIGGFIWMEDGSFFERCYPNGMGDDGWYLVVPPKIPEHLLNK